MWHGEMRMQTDYSSLRHQVICFRFFFHYHIHKDIHHPAKWALKKAPWQHVCRWNKPCHHVMKLTFAEMFRAAAHLHSTSSERAVLVWTSALCTVRRFHLCSHVEPKGPNQQPIRGLCGISWHCYMEGCWWASKITVIWGSQSLWYNGTTLSPDE